jgi:hypothetical protein
VGGGGIGFDGSGAGSGGRGGGCVRGGEVNKWQFLVFSHCPISCKTTSPTDVLVIPIITAKNQKLPNQWLSKIQCFLTA